MIDKMAAIIVKQAKIIEHYEELIIEQADQLTRAHFMIKELQIEIGDTRLLLDSTETEFEDLRNNCDERGWVCGMLT